MSHADKIESLLKKIEREKEMKKGDGVGRDLVKTFSYLLYKPKGWKAPRVVTPYPEEMPPKSTLAQMVEASYEPAQKAPEEIDGWELIKSTSTLKFYKKDKIIIVAIRGTADATDLRADFNIAFNTLRTTKRYNNDVKIMSDVYKEYSKEGVDFYGVSHSLGGSLADAFIKDGYIKRAVSYNPAVEKSELESEKNYRIYMENDPLFNTMGQYSKIGEIRKQNRVSRLDSVASVQSIKAHLMSNFKGGKLMGGADQEPEYEEYDEDEGIDHTEDEEEEEEEEEEDDEALDLRITTLMTHNINQLIEEEGDEYTEQEVEDIIISDLLQAGLHYHSNDRNELLMVREWLFDNLNPAHQAKALAEQFDDGGDIWGGGIFSDLKDKVTHIFGKSSKYNNISTKSLKEYGGMKIKELVATREKIQKALNFAMNLISSGNFGKETKKLGYDDLYHIRLFAKMENGTLLLIEKNEVIYIKPTDKIRGEPLPINYKEGSLTLQELMNAGEKSMGKNFFLYDAFTNNCASFVVGILKANKLWSDANTKFLAQDVSSLKAQLPQTSAVSNFITSLGAIVSRIQGKGKRKGKYSRMEDDAF